MQECLVAVDSSRNNTPARRFVACSHQRTTWSGAAEAQRNVGPATPLSAAWTYGGDSRKTTAITDTH